MNPVNIYIAALYFFRRVLPPITIAAEMIIIFLIMYCPSKVGAYGIIPSWKVTFGKIKRGINVPAICKKSNMRAYLIVLSKRKQTPIIISQYPIIFNHCRGDKKGIQYTVSKTKPSAADIPNGFKAPNQKKIMKSESFIKGVLSWSIFRIIEPNKFFIMLIIHLCNV